MSVTLEEITYVSDEEGNRIGVVVPIDLWRQIESERETAYLLSGENMKRRLLQALESRESDISFEDARTKLGI